MHLCPKPSNSNSTPIEIIDSRRWKASFVCPTAAGIQRFKPDAQVVFYSTFPTTFKIKLPKVIGDYNPDRGLMGHDETSKFVLQLIRETQFTSEAHLRLPHKKRKVICARKHFRSMNIDYRPIFPGFAAW
ncbi:MAG: hypothetical protein ONB44_10895 [candidate division KSB1 bacterium]|nr:hypothetical protein [candidate division KSB1 bacterium]MDZ7302631.1 hypothetical protein [candidate division KSB1 bacterium]MDZ7311530.1 hypothetical protein [candidate division KSB1 bacterium]